MALKIGFPFDSLTDTKDRAVNSDTYATMIRYKFDSGVFAQDTDGCKVTSANSGLSVNINIGHALIQGRFKEINEIVTLTPATASQTLPRIDRVILRMDNTISTRDIVPMILSGTPDDNPQPPALTLTENIYDISLAQIYVNTSATTITNANITDERDFCVMPVANGGTGASTTTATVNALKSDLVNLIYPVGAIYMGVNSANPSTWLGGTWVSWGSGKVPVGIDAVDSDFNTIEKTGGEKTHTLTAQEVPNVQGSITMHGAQYATNVNFTSGAFYADVTAPQYVNLAEHNTSGAASVGRIGFNNGGGNGAHNNLQPYVTCYMWKRTA